MFNLICNVDITLPPSTLIFNILTTDDRRYWNIYWRYYFIIILFCDLTNIIFKHSTFIFNIECFSLHVMLISSIVVLVTCRCVCIWCSDTRLHQHEFVDMFRSTFIDQIQQYMVRFFIKHMLKQINLSTFFWKAKSIKVQYRYTTHLQKI